MAFPELNSLINKGLDAEKKEGAEAPSLLT